MIDIYESAVQETGRFGAVYERDSETAYFYLLDLQKVADSQIISAFNIDNDNRMSPDLPVSVRWNETAAVVGLFIDSALIAIFDVSSNEPQGRFAEREDNRWFQPN